MKHEVIPCEAAREKAAGKPNLTGIPSQMKADFESRSGVSFDDVRVHYHSDLPAKIGALAYTQGTQVHIAPGQEQYLGHELGHVIQQKTMRIGATEYRRGTPVNTNPDLERGADALACAAQPARLPPLSRRPAVRIAQLEPIHASVSLIPIAAAEEEFDADHLLVDTIKLTGRADTGLTNSQNSPTQGDHTIADAAMKKYQKILVRGKPISQVLDFYRTQSVLLLYENDPTLSRKFLGFPRARAAREKASDLVGKIAQLMSARTNMILWRSELSHLITDYNAAYSYSIFATRGEGTGGHGEIAGMEAIRFLRGTWEGAIRKIFSVQQFKSLIDTNGTSFQNTFGANTNRAKIYLYRKLFHMLSQLVDYQGYQTSTPLQLNTPSYNAETQLSLFRDFFTIFPEIPHEDLSTHGIDESNATPSEALNPEDAAEIVKDDDTLFGNLCETFPGENLGIFKDMSTKKIYDTIGSVRDYLSKYFPSEQGPASRTPLNKNHTWNLFFVHAIERKMDALLSIGPGLQFSIPPHLLAECFHTSTLASEITPEITPDNLPTLIASINELLSKASPSDEDHGNAYLKLSFILNLMNELSAYFPDHSKTLM